MFAAIRLASSRSNNFAADLRPGHTGQLLSVGILHDKTSADVLDGARRRETAGGIRL